MSYQRNHYNNTIRIPNERNAKVYFGKRIDFISKNISLETNKKVIDIGCGDGLFLYYLEKKYPKLSCFGIDISLTQLKIAKNNNKVIKLNVAEAENLPFKNGTFDIIIFNSILHHVNSMELSLKEALRICKNEGIIIIIEPNRFNLLIFGLSLVKRYERGQLKINPKKIKAALNAEMQYLKISFINSLCYPYQKWPPKWFFSFIYKLENNKFIPSRIRTHFVIIAKKDKIYERIDSKSYK